MEELSLKEIQQGSLQVLKKVLEICSEQGITCSLMYGSLLGAVRHQGFIPWDDDIDVMMPRPDYERFIQYCIDNKDNLDYFELKHYRTCKEYIYGIARFCDSRYRIEYENAKDYGLGLFVDIYPFDGVDVSDTKYLKKLKYMQSIIFNCGWTRYIEHKGILKTIFKFPLYLYSRVTSVNKWLKRLDNFAQKYRYEDSEYIDCTAWGSEPEKYRIRKDVFDNVVWVPFEDINVPIVSQYDTVLKIRYNDYMKLPPENERVGHHYYKAFKKESLIN